MPQYEALPEAELRKIVTERIGRLPREAGMDEIEMEARLGIHQSLEEQMRMPEEVRKKLQPAVERRIRIHQMLAAMERPKAKVGGKHMSWAREMLGKIAGDLETTGAGARNGRGEDLPGLMEELLKLHKPGLRGLLGGQNIAALRPEAFSRALSAAERGNEELIRHAIGNETQYQLYDARSRRSYEQIIPHLLRHFKLRAESGE